MGPRVVMLADGDETMRDDLLARIRERLEKFAAENASEAVLSHDAALEVMALLNAVPDPSTDVDAVLAAGFLHWCRYLALGLHEGQADLFRARELLTPVDQAHPGLLPDEIREHLDGRGSHLGHSSDVLSREKLSHHGERLFTEATRTGQAAPLNQSIDLFRRALAATPGGHPLRVGILSNLATALQRRFAGTGAATDVDEAIELGREAVAATPEGHPSHHLILSSLSGALWARFIHRKMLSDLEESLRTIRRAVEVTPPADPDRGRYLSNLSNILRTRFEWTGIMAELDEAVALGRQAVAATPTGHPQYATMLTNLGVALQTRFARAASLPDLAEAIENFTRAVAATPPGHPHVAVTLGNLSAAVLIRFSQTGAVADLTTAVDIARQAVAATPAGSPDRAKRLSNLGNILRSRFARAGHSADLDEAVDACRQAVAATPVDHSERAGMLTNFGAVLGQRADRTGLSVDLDEAVDACRQAVAATPVDHSARAAVFSNLCTALCRRFRLTGVATNLDEAVETARQAVAIAGAAGDGLVLAATLSDLGEVFRLRYDRSGNLGDLDGSVEAYRKAVAATRADSPDRARVLSGLGLTLWGRFERTGIPADRDDGLAAFRTAAGAVAAPPSIRAKAAGAWASMAVTADNWAQAVDGYATAVDSMTRVAPRSLSRQDQEYRLSSLSRSGSYAAACCLQIGDVERALELWERGRGTIFGQILDARTDLTDLAATHPETATRFRSLRDELDRLPDRHEPLTARTAPELVTNDTLATGRGNDDGDRRHALAEQFERLVAEIRTLPDFERFLLPARADELRRAAQQGPIVAVNVSEIRCDALILTRTGVQVLPLPGLTADMVGQQVVDFLTAVERNDEPRLSQILGWLWDVLAEPVLGRLEIHGPPGDGAPWPRMWWCLSGLLSFLPVHAAGRHHTRFDPAPATLIDRVISSYTPTIRALAHGRRPAPGPASSEGTTTAGGGGVRVLVVAMPHTPGAGDLPGARAEAEGLQQRFTGRAGVLVEGEATRDAVLAALPRARWAHFACHGIADIDAPSASRLLLHDRPLTALDVTRLQLVDAELAFLSACETARPGGELSDEAIHLASAFHLAGYRHVIATLWPVSDQQAVQFAESIYNDLGDSVDAARAVHAATHALRDYAARYPSLWASHIHVGG